MTIRSRDLAAFVAISFANALIVGCAAPSEGPTTSEADQTESSIVPNGNAVTWEYVRGQGWGTVLEQRRSAGTIDVSFIGDEVRNGPRTAQAARVTVVAPQFGNPAQNAERVYSVRFDVITNADGTKTYATGAYTNAIIVDNALPNAETLFERSYDESRGIVRAGSYFAAGQSGQFTLKSEPAGAVRPSAPFRISTSPKAVDYVIQNESITLAE